MSQTTMSPESGSSTTDRLVTMAHETLDRVSTKANRAEHEVREAAMKSIAFAPGALVSALVRR